MPPQVRRRPLGPPSAITTGVSQRRPGGGLEGMGNRILSESISQLLSDSDGDAAPLGSTDLGTLGGIAGVPLAGGASGPTEPDFLEMIRQVLKGSV
jgi:hypothetical protein